MEEMFLALIADIEKKVEEVEDKFEKECDKLKGRVTVVEVGGMSLDEGSGDLSLSEMEDE